MDIDPENASAKVLVLGKVPLQQMADVIQRAARELMTIGGYRHKSGGGVRHQVARAEFSEEFERMVNGNRYYTAPAHEPHPQLLAVPADCIQTNKGVSLVVGGSTIAASAANKGCLFSGNHTILCENEVARFWAGAMVPAGALSDRTCTLVP